MKSTHDPPVDKQCYVDACVKAQGVIHSVLASVHCCLYYNVMS